ncbi:FAD-dependent oxidoreductase [Microbacterium sp. P03]|uniref:FAD-dependent oxidoreductase n=1 Tax=Microbacterium sp. P03 TaxID=3366946 RepID=UPI003745A9C5
MPDVIVIGAGPVGLLLAGELRRRDIDVEVLERRAAAGDGTRAIGIHAPVLAALEQSGITDELLARAVRVPRGLARARGKTLGIVRFDLLSTRFPFVATLPQARTERILTDRAPVPRRDTTVTSVVPSRDAVRVSAHDGERTSPIVVVASGSGGRDLVFRPGAVPLTTYPDRYLMTDAAAGVDADPDVAVVNLDPTGVMESFPLPDGQRRYVAWDAPGGDDDPARRLERLRAAVAVRGEPDAAEGITWASSFGVRRYVAPRMRRGRLFVIGDAAHEVSPIGGQGMNLGLLDAAGLAPLLARWVRTGVAPDDDLGRWETRRVRSALRAARLAALNTDLGRAMPGVADTLRRTGVRAMLAPPAGRLFAHAYAMGLDAGA